MMGGVIYPTLESEGCPKPVSAFVPWEERIKRSAGFVTCAFSYEVHWPLNAVQTGIKITRYQLRTSSRSLLCAVVSSRPSYLQQVQPGDVLLRINDDILISLEEPKSFEFILNALESTASPTKTIRFLRPAGLLLQPSPAEALLLANNPNVTARFDVGMANAEPSSLNMRAIDTKAPSIVKKLMMGQHINWEPYYTPPSTSTSTASLYSTLSMPGVSPANRDAVIKSFGVYRDRHKWVAVSRPKRSIEEVYSSENSLIKGRDTRPFFLGRFDSEQDAIRAYLKAHEEVQVGRVLVNSRAGRGVMSISAPPSSGYGAPPPQALTPSAAAASNYRAF